ncbi:MAG: hypothetical protein ABIN20_03360 [candidate division WOR-3 bacterium]
MSNNLNNKETYDDLIEKIASRICDLKLETIFIIIFESIKPLSFIASSVLVAFEPIIRSIFSFRDYERFYRMLEDRENIEKLIRKIEELSEKR